MQGINVTTLMFVENFTDYEDYSDDYADYYDIGQRAQFFLQTPHIMLQVVLGILAIGVNAASLAALASAAATVPYARLIASLACSDILIGASLLAHFANLVTNPLHGLDAAPHDRLRSRCAAVVVAAVNSTAINISLLNLLGMAVDHYVAIMRPLRYPVLLSRRRSRCMIAALWALAFVLGHSDVIVVAGKRLVSSSSRARNRNFCEDVYWHKRYNREHATFALTFVCLIALVGVYARIYVAVRRLHRLGGGGTNGHASNSRGGHGPAAAVGSGSRKALVTTLLVLGTFLVCWMPNCLFEMSMEIKIHIDRESIQRHAATYYRVNSYLYSLMVVNALSDPLIYALRLSDVRRSYRRLFRRAADACLCMAGQRRQSRRRRDGSLHTNESSLLSEDRRYSQRSAVGGAMGGQGDGGLISSL